MSRARFHLFFFSFNVTVNTQTRLIHQQTYSWISTTQFATTQCSGNSLIFCFILKDVICSKSHQFHVFPVRAIKQFTIQVWLLWDQIQWDNTKLSNFLERVLWHMEHKFVIFGCLLLSSCSCLLWCSLLSVLISLFMFVTLSMSAYQIWPRRECISILVI